MKDAELSAFIRKENAVIMVEPGFPKGAIQAVVIRRFKPRLFASGTSAEEAIDLAIAKAEGEQAPPPPPVTAT